MILYKNKYTIYVTELFIRTTQCDVLSPGLADGFVAISAHETDELIDKAVERYDYDFRKIFKLDALLFSLNGEKFQPLVHGCVQI